MTSAADPQPISHRDSTHVDASPQEVYDLVSDITRTGEWSVVCRAGEWLDPGSTGVGARFQGHNQTATRAWTTTSTVVAAEPGEHFAWEVGDGFVHWGYRMRPDGEGTELTHEWTFLPAGQQMFVERYGDDAAAEVEQRTRSAHESIPQTLARVKEIAERGIRPMGHTETIEVAASPQEVYDLVSDITRTGEWSVGCRAAEWLDPEQTGLGATFVGHNATPERQWDTTNTVVHDVPGKDFAWEVGDGWSRWGYRLRPTETGTQVTHFWSYLPAGQAFWGAKHGDQAQAQREIRLQAAQAGMPRTLAAIKEIVEAGRA